MSKTKKLDVYFNNGCVAEPIRLKEFQPAWVDQVIWTWCNPPRYFAERLTRQIDKVLVTDKLITSNMPEPTEGLIRGNQVDLQKTLIVLWSKGPPGTQLDQEDIYTLQDQGPNLYGWVVHQSLQAIIRNCARQIKKFEGKKGA
ncbi:MAG: hypothetical protein P4L50_24670 [Anaerolineaceae bacterium]|nr:hypothetical protein [Anaerolineaceae bacterium]